MKDNTNYSESIGRTLRKALSIDYDVSQKAKIHALPMDSWRNGILSLSHQGTITGQLVVIYPYKVSKGEPSGMIYAEIYPEGKALTVFYQVLSVKEFDELRTSLNASSAGMEFRTAA